LFSLANIAQFERKQVSERVTANQIARAKRGLFNGGTIPCGYKSNPYKKGYLEIEPKDATLIKKIFELYLKTETLAATAKWLNSHGYRVKRSVEGGGNHRLGFFTVMNVHCFLNNKAYIGIRVYKEKGVTQEAPAAWEPIIEKDVFEEVQKRLKENCSRFKPMTSKNRYPYLLSGLVSCKTCGFSLTGKSAHGNGGKIPYYEHSWSTRRQSGLVKKVFDCKPHRVPAKKLEPLVGMKLKSF